MKIFIKEYFIKDSYLYKYSLELKTIIESKTNYKIIQSPYLCDVIILQIGEINDLYNLPDKYCFLYFHYKPNNEELKLIYELINSNKISIFSPYNISPVPG